MSSTVAVFFSEVNDVLQICGPYSKGSSTSRFGVKVMSFVLHNETQVEVPGEIYRELDLFDIGGVYDIRWEPSKGTGCIWSCEIGR